MSLSSFDQYHVIAALFFTILLPTYMLTNMIQSQILSFSHFSHEVIIPGRYKYYEPLQVGFQSANWRQEKGSIDYVESRYVEKTQIDLFFHIILN